MIVDVIINKGSTSNVNTSNVSGLNVGTGNGIFAGKDSANLLFKSLVAGTNITITNNSGDLTLTSAISGSSIVDWTNVINKPTIFPPEQHSHQISGVSGLSGILSGLIGASGSYYLTNNPNNFATSGNLSTTGNSLYNYINSLSGNSDLKFYLSSNSNNFSTTGNLVLSGNSLYSQLTGLSGFSNLNYYLISNPNNFSNSGNVFNTGSALYLLLTNESGQLISYLQSSGSNLNNKIDSLSGYSNNNFATVTNLAGTGANLYSYILLASGQPSGARVTNLNTLTNGISITGTGMTTVSVIGQTIYVSGNSGNFVLRSETGQFYPLSNPNNFPTSGNLQTTGSTLYSYVVAASGGQASGIRVTDLNTLSNSVNITGTGMVSVSVVGQQIIISGITGNFVTRSETGQFYQLANPNQFSTSGNLTGVSGVLNTKVENSGSYLFNLIGASAAGVGSINSQSGNLTLTGAGNVVVSVAGQSFTISGNTGEYSNFVKRTETGQFYPLTNPNSFSNSGNLQTSGSTLYNFIVAASGGQASGARVTDLNALTNSVTITGTGNMTVSVVGQIIYISGATGSFVTRSETGQFYQLANPNAFSTSGNVELTGSALQTQLNTLNTNTGLFTGIFYPRSGNPSGFLNTLNSGHLQTQIFNSGSNLSTRLDGTGNLYPLNNPNNFANSGNLLSTGANLYNYITVISGQLPTASSKVTGLNTLTGAINITGTGLVTVSVINQTIIISGNTSISGNLFTTGANLYSYINSASGNFLSASQTGAYTGAFYPRYDNPSGYIAATTGLILNGQLLIGGSGDNSFNVGNLYGISNISVISGSGSLGISGDISVLATVNNLQLTGSTLYAYILAGSGTTGTSTGSYYPLNSNPSGYVRSISGVLYGDLTGIINDGQLFIGTSGNNSLVLGNLYGISNISITSGSGSLGLSVDLSQTGNFTGAFYPRYGNPSGYVSQFFVTGMSGVLQAQITGGGSPTTNNYYINSGSGIFLFRSPISNGINKQFIASPANLNYGAFIVANLRNDTDNTILPCTVSGAINTGFWAVFANTTNNTGYYLDVFACNTTGTGFAVSVINNTNLLSGSLFSVTGSSTIANPNFTGIGGFQIIYSGNYVLLSGGGGAGGEVNTASNLGGAVGVYSTKVGADLQFNSISGGTGIQVSLSGNNIFINSTLNTGQFYPLTNPNQYANSGDLISYTTGSILDGQLLIGTSGENSLILGNLYGINNIYVISGSGNLGVSGDFSNYYLLSNPNSFSTSGNLLSSGAALYNYITVTSGQLSVSRPSVSGLNTLTGDVRITGTGMISVSVLGSTIYISGATGNFITRSETGQFYQLANPNSFSTSGNLLNTGSNLYNYILSSSGLQQSSGVRVTNLNGLSNGINITGTGNMTVSVVGQIIYISGYTGDFVLRSESGQFYQKINPNQFSTSGFVTSASGTLQTNLDTLTTNLQASGSTLYRRVTGLNTLTGAVLVTGTGIISVSVSNQTIFVSGDTSTLYPLSNPNSFSTSGNLFASGFDLDTKINSLSGYSNNTFATISNLQLTGSTLYNFITITSGQLSAARPSVSGLNTLTGDVRITGTGMIVVSVLGNTIYVSGNTGTFLTRSETGQFYTLNNPNNFSTSGNLEATGANLYSYIVSASGNFLSASQTGNYTGAFYPRYQNPSGYVASTSGTVYVEGNGNILDGQLLIGGSGDNSFGQGNLYGLTGISVISGSGSLGLGVKLGYFPNVWSVISGPTTISSGNNYIIDWTGTVNLTLPTTFGIGNPFYVTSICNSGFKIIQNTSQQMRFGNTLTTGGTSGYIQSTSIGDSIQLVCTSGNFLFSVLNSVGNFIIN